MSTDIFDGNRGAKMRLCVEISSGTLPSLSHSRVVFGPTPLDKAGERWQSCGNCRCGNRSPSSHGTPDFQHARPPSFLRRHVTLTGHCTENIGSLLPFLFPLQIWNFLFVTNGQVHRGTVGIDDGGGGVENKVCMNSSE